MWSLLPGSAVLLFQMTRFQSSRLPRAVMLSIIMVVLTTVHAQGQGCEMFDRECEFDFVVDNKLTMMSNQNKVFPADDDLFLYNAMNTSDATPIPEDDVIVADGFETSRLVTVVNGQLPGPDIVVFVGQKVIVNVKNNLMTEGTTIHWHGLHQLGTPWMDGVPWVSQCPILPGQTFRYEFIAEPKGTFWWHSHQGTQRSMGMYGALIVKDRKESPVQDHIMQIMDWNHDVDSDYALMQFLYGLYEGREKFEGVLSLDGGLFHPFVAQSGLINGKGRYYYDPVLGLSNMAPLTVYRATPGVRYRFRVIGAGTLYPFRVSVDDHNMAVVASDGYDVVPYYAESFIISPGERYDFEITADQPIGNYWVRAITVVQGPTQRADAILRYDGAPHEDPTTSRRNCIRRDPCYVVNCPFKIYTEPHTICVPVSDLRNLATDQPAPPVIEGRFKEFFLNFGFPGINTRPASVNGRNFVAPDVNPLIQPTEWNYPCKAPECGEDQVCRCTHAVEFDKDDTVQMVFTNMGRGRGTPHPIHMHGHSFYVLKMGFGNYNETTGEVLEDNPDVNCRGNPDRTKSFCNDATWKKSSWLNGTVPKMELLRPPRKDTIIVPTGGYVVVRILGNNPGIWNMHCHIEQHNVGGMRLLLNESFADMPIPPPGLPTCRSFPPRYPLPNGTPGDYAQSPPQPGPPMSY